MQSNDVDAFGSDRTVTMTILGNSGSGKTVFLSALYSELAEGVLGFSAAGDDKTDRTLGGAIRDLYLKKELPDGTTDNGLHYAFSLMYDGEPVARVECFDYRGGLTDEDAESPAGKALQMRIADSDVIMWMIDLSDMADLGALTSKRARLTTNLRRLQSICSQAIKNQPRLRAWSFIRTKVDVDFPDLNEESLSRATEQLLEHLGDVITISTYKNTRYANLVSIAPLGVVTAAENGAFVAGDEVVNVQWPLLVSLGTLMKARRAILDEQIDGRELSSESGGGWFPFSRNDRVTSDSADSMVVEEKERDFLTTVLDRIANDIPDSVMVLGDSQPDLSDE